MEGGKVTPQEQLAFLIEKRDMCLDNMEGADWDEMVRWDALYGHYAAIVEDMEAEMKGEING